MRSERLLALVAVGVGLSLPANAYTLLGWNWSWQQMPASDAFYINHSSFPSWVGTTDDVRSALENGMDRWAAEGGADFAFNYAGSTTNTSFGTDGLHIAQFSSGTTGGATVAVAQSFGVGSRMTDCDVRFYNTNGLGQIPWSADPGGATFAQMDLEQVATHEFGHCAGLDHSSNFSAVMYGAAASGGGVAQRVLHPDDQLGLQAIYGVAVGSDLNLSVLDPIVAGETVRVEVSGADVGDRVHLALSTVGEGPGPCYARLGGRCADILAPITPVDSARANHQGEVVLTWDVPPTFAGTRAGLQAVTIRGLGGADSLMSNAVSATVLQAGTSCPLGTVPDCDGFCWDLTWPGDGFCDDGSTHQWGNANFNCSLFHFDEGDCN